jgi:2-polyprenyl-6-methoxyphenol hydroxylase-like FAD-dependent oxidoreductase
MKAINIAVCGCGPAGLAAALLLHRAGHRVTLFERFDAPRPLGSGLLLQPTGLSVLGELDLLAPLRALGCPIDLIRGRIPSGRIVLNVRYDAMGQGWRALAVHRAALFGVLHGAVVAAGIPVVHGCDIRGVVTHADQAELVCSDDRRHGGFDLVVNAAGANSPLAAGHVKRTSLEYGALWVNVPGHAWAESQHVLEQRYVRASTMAGVLPIGCVASDQQRLCAFFWSLRRDRFEAWQAEGVVAWKQSVAALWPDAAKLLESVTDLSQVTFAQYDHFTLKQPFGERLAHIGDASHATSPQLGQGANMALLDALALSRALSMHDSLAAALAAYAAMRAWHIRVFQWASATFTPFYQSDGRALPFVRDWLAGPLSNLPVGRHVLARLVSGMTLSALRGSAFEPQRLD